MMKIRAKHIVFATGAGSSTPVMPEYADRVCIFPLSSRLGTDVVTAKISWFGLALSRLQVSRIVAGKIRNRDRNRQHWYVTCDSMKAVG